MGLFLAEGIAQELPTLFLGLTHESFANAPTITEWEHWKPHATDCTSHIIASKGFTPTGQCDCDSDRSRPVGRPTFAPVEHVLTDTPNGFPLTAETLTFPFWVFDEVGLDKFIDPMVVTKDDLNDNANHHPSNTVKLVARALSQLLTAHATLNEEKTRFTASNWRGGDFYHCLDVALIAQGSSLAGLMKELPLSEEELDDSTWSQYFTPATLPTNFSPRLFEIIMREVGNFRTGKSFNPCIHVVKEAPSERKPVESIIKIYRRKFVPHYMPSVILDATADPMLLEKVFGPIHRVHITNPPYFPHEQVRVRQELHNILGRTTLTSKTRGNKLVSKYRKLLQSEVMRYKRDLGNRQIRVGLLTFKLLEDDCKAALIEIGIGKNNIITEHYWNLRGKNDFIKPVPCDLLVVIGYPRPNGEGLYQEACALFSDDEAPILREQKYSDELLNLSNGRSVTVKGMDSYEDPRLQALYVQKSRAELTQAFHRARPYLDEGIKDILVFTDVPIPFVTVDGFIGEEGEMFEALKTMLQQDGEARVNDMADCIFEVRGIKPTSTKRESLITHIKRSKDWLIEVSGTEFIAGTSKKNPGRFVVV